MAGNEPVEAWTYEIHKVKGEGCYIVRADHFPNGDYKDSEHLDEGQWSKMPGDTYYRSVTSAKRVLREMGITDVTIYEPYVEPGMHT